MPFCSEYRRRGLVLLMPETGRSRSARRSPHRAPKHALVYDSVRPSADLHPGPPNERKGMTILRFIALNLVALMSLVATSVHARRRGGGGGDGEDPIPWLTEFVAYILLGMLALAVVGALWRYFTRPSAADLARERNMRRLSSREAKATQGGEVRRKRAAPRSVAGHLPETGRVPSVSPRAPNGCNLAL